MYSQDGSLCIRCKKNLRCLKHKPELHNTQIKPLRYMVCHDGSSASIDALEMIHNGIIKENDQLTVANIWSFNKEKYLDYRFKHKNI